MRKNIVRFFFVFLIAFGTMRVSAFDVSGTAPRFIPANPAVPPEAVIELNREINSAFTDALRDINDQVGGIDSKPEKFIRAWGDASVISSHAATQRTFTDFRLFNVTLGGMIGLVLPASPFEMADYLENITDRLNEEQDLRLGINPQVINLQVGLNLGFLVPNLSAAVRFGYMDINNFLVEGFSFNSLTLGLLVNYQLLPAVNLVPRELVLWRGISLGTGLIYQRTNIDFGMGLGEISQPINNIGTVNTPAGNMNIGQASIVLDPTLNLGLRVNTVTIPIEAHTSVRLLRFLNFAFGLGFDLGFGSSVLKLGMRSDIDVRGLNENVVRQSDEGSLTVSGGGKMSPTVFNFKLMSGMGFTLGPVIIDFPIAFYPINQGFQAGFTVGVSF